MPFRLAAALCAAVTAATPALSLSCLMPDPVSAFAQANAAPENYVVVLGRFSGGPGPRPDGSVDGTPRSYGARFEGHVLNRDGPTREIRRDVRVTETCAGPWCADLPVGQTVLTFLRTGGGTAALDLGPCYANLFTAPSPEQIEAVQACFETNCLP